MKSLNPFRTGRCLSTQLVDKSTPVGSLNPFRTGRCLSTYEDPVYAWVCIRLNPFRTGRCLSTLQLLPSTH